MEIGSESDRIRDPAGKLCKRTVGDESRIVEDDFLSVFNERKDRGVECARSARGDEDVGRFKREAVFCLKFCGDRGTQFVDSCIVRISGFSFCDRFDCSVFDILRGVEVRLAETHVDGSGSRRLEHLSDTGDIDGFYA